MLHYCREVPLRVGLVYETGETGDNVEVKNQSILKLSNVRTFYVAVEVEVCAFHSLFDQDSVTRVDKTGKVVLRVRIEEVSKNHQKQVRPHHDFILCCDAVC